MKLVSKPVYLFLGICMLITYLFLSFAFDTNALSINVEAGLVSIADDGKCSLIEAIENANDTNTGQPHTDCQPGDPSGQDEIQLAASSIYTVNEVNNSGHGRTGLPLIRSKITIYGNDSIIERDLSSVENFRLFTILTTGELALNNLTIRNGVTRGNTGGGIYDNGGGIYNDNGKLNLLNCVMENNVADALVGQGGAVASYGGEVAIVNTIFQNNLSRLGGAILNGGTMIIKGSTINDNIGSQGGGIYSYPYSSNASLTVEQSTFFGNSATDGGAIYSATNFGGSIQVEIINSTFSQNSASDEGGVFYITTDLWSTDGKVTVTLQNSTIVSNTAATGNIFYQSTNPGGEAKYYFNSSIFVGINDGKDCYTQDGTIYSQGYNLSNFSQCGLNQTDTIMIDPSAVLELSLGDNGGPTQTFALLQNSEAIDKIPDNILGCEAGISVDQRGEVRAGGSLDTGGIACDIGSYEYHWPILPTMTSTSTSTPVPTQTSTPTPTNTPIPTLLLTQTSTPTPTNTPIPTLVSTQTSTTAPTNTTIPTLVPTQTSTTSPTNTTMPTLVPTQTSTAIIMETPTVTPQPVQYFCYLPAVFK